MPTQVDTNGAIVDSRPAASSDPYSDSYVSPDVVTVRHGFDWGFWGVLALGAWWVWHELSPPSASRRRRRR
jgi:hypothetical protein